MATKLDFGYTIGGTAYDYFAPSFSLTEEFDSPATWNMVLEGTTTSDFAIVAKNAVFQLYEYDAAGAGTVAFLGMVNSIKRLGFNSILVSGYDNGGKLLNTNITGPNVGASQMFESGDAETLGSIVNKLCSTNLDGSAPWIVTVGTVDDSTMVVGKFIIPATNRWAALLALSRRVGKELYTDPVLGTLQMRTSRGNSSSVKTYSCTGASTNAYSSNHVFTNENVMNDIISVAAGKDLTSRYQDISTTFTKLSAGDTITTASLSDPAGGFISGTPTIYVRSTDGWPATGRVVIKGITPAFAISSNTYFDYTSKTATSITGAFGLPAVRYVPTRAAVLLTSVIKVVSTSGFPASGTLLIGDELIDYSGILDSTTFTVSQTVNYRRCRINYTDTTGTQTSTATTINATSTAGFPTSGTINILVSGLTSESVTYTGTTGSSFTGCNRGMNSSKPLDLPASSSVILNLVEKIHPKGVLVYKYVATPDANSSIGLNGRRPIPLRLEMANAIDDVESQTSRFLEIHKWGDESAQLSTANVFDYRSVLVGDKVTANDSTLSWSSYEVRVLAKTLTLDKNGGNYEISYSVATYSNLPREGNLPTDSMDMYARMTGAKEGTVSGANTDSDVKNVSEVRTSGGVSVGFQPPSGCALFTNENASGYVFTNNVWADTSKGTAHWGTPVYLYGVQVDVTGLFYPSQLTPVFPLVDPTGVEGAMYYNTITKTYRWYNGTGWSDLAGGTTTNYWARDAITGFVYPATITDFVMVGDPTAARMSITAFSITATAASGNVDFYIKTRGVGGNIIFGRSDTVLGSVAAVYSAVDATSDLGTSSYKWKDAHFSGTVNSANVLITGTLSANASVGTAGQLLTSNGASAAYWADNFWTRDSGTGIIHPTTAADFLVIGDLAAARVTLLPSSLTATAAAGNVDFTIKTRGVGGNIIFARSDTVLGSVAAVYSVVDATSDLGTSSYKWKDGYFSGTLNTASVVMTGTMSANGGVGTAGQVLTSNGASAAYWSAVSSYWSRDAGVGYVYPTTVTDFLLIGDIAADRISITPSSIVATKASGNLDFTIKTRGVGGNIIFGRSDTALGSVAAVYSVVDATSDLGTSSYKWKNGYFSGTVNAANALITGTLSANASVGSAGQVLTSNGASPAAWAAPTGVYWSRNSGTGYLYPSTAADFVMVGDPAAARISILPASIIATAASGNVDFYIKTRGSGGNIIFGRSDASGSPVAVYPAANVTSDLGTSGYQWLGVYTRKLLCSTESTARLRLPVGTNMYG